MARKSGADGAATGRGRGRIGSRDWSLDPEQARQLVAGARNALFVMTGILALIWILQLVNAAEAYRLTESYGIRPRDIAGLPYLFTAPFLHFSWTHIEGNSGPLFIFGFLAAYRGIAKFAGVSVVTIITSGLAAWIFESPNSVGAGASGVVFGYFGYIIVRGLFDRHAIDVLIGAVMALCFAYQFTVLLPHQGIGWQAHVGGLVGGIASGWILRDRQARARAAAPAASTGAGVPGAPPALGSAHGALARAKTTRPRRRPAESGRAGFAADPSNPRADLHKQLDDLGL